MLLPETNIMFTCQVHLNEKKKKTRGNDGENSKVGKINKYFAQEVYLSQITAFSFLFSLHFTK